jgi:hypothetical protein
MPRHRTLHVLLVIVLALLLLLIVRLHSAAAQVIDPHALYEQKCARCHEPHASALAKESVVRKDGALVGKESGRPLSTLLTNHRGTRLNEAEIKALVDHFGAMSTTGWLYQEKCLGCHDTAVKLARTMLIMRGEHVVGRYSGTEMETFLAGHGRLEAGEVGVIVSMLRRQLETKPD